jgi:hypothetical protein
MFLFFYKIENRRAEQVLPREGISGRKRKCSGKGVGEGI